MSCKRNRKLIHSYMDGFLDERLEGEFLGHIEECEGCRAELSSHMAMQADLRSLPDPLPDKDFRQSWLARLERRQSRPRYSWFGNFERFSAASAMAAAAVVIVFVFAVSSLGYFVLDTEDTSPAVFTEIADVTYAEELFADAEFIGGDAAGAILPAQVFAAPEAGGGIGARAATVDIAPQLWGFGGVSHSGVSGSMGIFAEDFEGAVSHVDSVAMHRGLHVESFSLSYLQGDLRETSYTLRVPYGAFGEVMDELAAFGGVRSRAVSDFGGEFREGSYSTIWISVTEGAASAYYIDETGVQTGLGTRMADAFAGSVGVVINFSQSLLVFLASALVPAILAIAALLLGWYTYRKLARRK